MKIKDLNPEILGELLLRVAPVAMQAQHEWPKSTMIDYINPTSEGEAEFIRDLFTLKTEEIIEKWYGGRDGAAQLLFPR